MEKTDSIAILPVVALIKSIKEQYSALDFLVNTILQTSDSD